MSDLLDLEFLTVIGKGGVGKTTVSAALALEAARRGKRVLLAMCNVKERASHLLEVPPIGHDIVTIAPRLHAVNMNPARALEEYGMMILKVRTLYRAIFENRLVAAFLRGTPGIEPWSMLGKAYFHAVNDHDESGRRRYDLVILDAPATGHGLEMLRVPRVLMHVMPPGLLRTEAEKALALFHDARRSGVVLVTLPEEMPVTETLELYDVVKRELHMPVARVVVNSVLERVFNGDEVALVTKLAASQRGGALLAPLLRAGERRARREVAQRVQVERVARHVPVPKTELPYIFTSELGRRDLEALATRFAGPQKSASAPP